MLNSFNNGLEARCWPLVTCGEAEPAPEYLCSSAEYNDSDHSVQPLRFGIVSYIYKLYFIRYIVRERPLCVKAKS